MEADEKQCVEGVKEKVRLVQHAESISPSP